MIGPLKGGYAVIGPLKGTFIIGSRNVKGNKRCKKCKATVMVSKKGKDKIKKGSTLICDQCAKGMIREKDIIINLGGHTPS